MMPERHRLGGLHMREARHRVGGEGGGAAGQHAHQVADLGDHRVRRIAHPQAEIGRHLVVAAARRVQPLAGLADALGQPRLDVHVDIFQPGVEDEVAGRDLLSDRH
jgi:hypothetical protein